MLQFVIIVFIFFVLITVHEFGHFLAAKLVRVPVEKLSIGYPPKLYSRIRGKTEYCLSLLPFGSYIKIPEIWLPVTRKYKKITILLSGPFFDFLFAFILFVITSQIIGTTMLDNTNRVGQVLSEFPAEKAGIRPGDLILRIDNHSVHTWSDYQKIIRQFANQEVTVTWSRKDSIFKKEMIPAIWECPVKGKIVKMTTLGITPNLIKQKIKLDTSFQIGFKELYGSIVNISTYIFKLFTGREKLSKLSGPIGFFQLTKEHIGEGLIIVLNFIAVLSVYLGFLELLPIPGRDGGHLLMTAIEGIRRKPIPENPKLLIETLGTVILLFLIVYLTINDISRL